MRSKTRHCLCHFLPCLVEFDKFGRRYHCSRRAVTSAFSITRSTISKSSFGMRPERRRSCLGPMCSGSRNGSRVSLSHYSQSGRVGCPSEPLPHPTSTRFGVSLVKISVSLIEQKNEPDAIRRVHLSRCTAGSVDERWDQNFLTQPTVTVSPLGAFCSMIVFMALTLTLAIYSGMSNTATPPRPRTNTR